MAKDNLFLGMARGSVGDVVFYRSGGQQVARARNRNPRNPQTPLQLLQRVILSTVGRAYSFLSPLADHSFEGIAAGQLSQQEFMKENISLMRDKIADLLARPVEDEILGSNAYNFNYSGDVYPVINDYLISRGSLPSQDCTFNDGAVRVRFLHPFNLAADTIPTYQQIADGLSAKQGDQLTIIALCADSSSIFDRELIHSIHFARVILEPATGGMTTPFLTAEGAINSPNERNEGALVASVLRSGDTEAVRLAFTTIGNYSKNDAAEANLTLNACGAILSRWDGSKWARSTQNLSPSVEDNARTIAEAYLSYKSEVTSSLYLNQSQV